MKRRKSISAVPVAILLAQQTSAVMAQTRKKMLMNRIGTSSCKLSAANGDGSDDRKPLHKAMPPYIRAKVY